jgi:hypothetical protein
MIGKSIFLLKVGSFFTKLKCCQGDNKTVLSSQKIAARYGSGWVLGNDWGIFLWELLHGFTIFNEFRIG